MDTKFEQLINSESISIFVKKIDINMDRQLSDLYLNIQFYL